MLQLEGITSGLLLTYVGSECTAWLVVCSPYTNRRGIEKLYTCDKCTISYSTTSWLLRSVSRQFNCLHNLQLWYRKQLSPDLSLAQLLVRSLHSVILLVC